MTTEYLGLVFTFLASILLALPLARYLAKVFLGEKTMLDFLNPLESFIFKKSGIDPKRKMNWKEFLQSMLWINSLWFIYGFAMLCLQGKLPLNPDHNPSMSADLSFNTILSFISNCDLQDYSGETGLTYLTQLGVITFLQFVSAATGIACAVAVFNAFRNKTTQNLGNFWVIFTKTITRVLIPISLVIALILAWNGTPSSFKGKDTVITLQGDTQQISRGPAAGMIAIKHLGTNGGGWFGANSAHPLENPNYLTNIVEMVAQCLLPMAVIFALGIYIKQRRLSFVIFAIMTLGTLSLLIPTVLSEVHGNPMISQMHIAQTTGAMEGKEVRFGPAASGYWSIFTTIISTGSVNGMHDSFMPMSGLMQMLAMLVNAFYGGCGVGFLNYFIYIVITVFIAGLMVGRTPELLGHKVEAREVKIAALVTLLSAFLIKCSTAVAVYLWVHHPNASWSTPPSAWLNNPSFHGFSEMFYQYISSNANNGSGFEGLNDNTPFWNISAGLVILLGRFLPIIGPVAIAGILANKKYIPPSSGTLRTDSLTFGITTLIVIVIITALSYFPPLVIGPIAEYLSIH